VGGACFAPLNDKEGVPLKAKTLLVVGLVAIVVAAVVFEQTVGFEDAYDRLDRWISNETTEDGYPGNPNSQRFVSSIDRPNAVVWAVGDGGIDSPEARSVVQLIEEAGVDRFLYLGDVYEHGTAEAFETEYEPTYGQLAARTAPTTGNHEALLAEEGYGPYWEEQLGAPTPPYYAFRISGWDVLSLNSEIDHDRGSPQVKWVRRQVAPGGDCRIAFWHRARFNAGVEAGDQPDLQPLWEAVRERARIVISGHEHNMQAFRVRGGITELVSGAGGAELHGVNASDPRLLFGNDSEWGALRLKLRPRHASYAFVSSEGDVLHRGRVSCRP
jgi:predicted phosphodiesterase